MNPLVAHHCVFANNVIRDSSTLIDRHGQIVGVYNKNQVTIGERIESGILYGRETPVFACDFGRVAFAICFDLNFDGLRLKYVKAKPDLIVFSSVYHGGLMQAYWAYSCRAHFVGAVAGLPCEIRNPRGEDDQRVPDRITRPLHGPSPGPPPHDRKHGMSHLRSSPCESLHRPPVILFCQTLT